MAKIRSWEVSDSFWERVSPLIPVLLKRNIEKEYKRKAGGGRKPMEPRKVFFLQLWRAGLAEHDELEGIAWEWQSIDGSMVKAPLAIEAVRTNPTDRGKKWKQAAFAGGRAWHPVVDSRNRSKQT